MFSSKVDYSNVSDFILLSQLQGGDHRAFIEIYDRYYKVILTFCLKKLKDKEQAKDIVQDVFTNIWHKREKLEIKSSLPGFLIISAKNRILDLFAHSLVQTKFRYTLTDSDQLSNGTDFLIREKQLQFQIKQAVDSLPKKRRKVFELSRYENLSRKEIAKTLSLSERTVNNHLVNALSRLKSILGLF
jgi:RNA polymerase sigma-70 factor (family 1)